MSRPCTAGTALRATGGDAAGATARGARAADVAPVASPLALLPPPPEAAVATFPLPAYPARFCIALAPFARFWRHAGMSVDSEWPAAMANYARRGDFAALLAEAETVAVLLDIDEAEDAADEVDEPGEGEATTAAAATGGGGTDGPLSAAAVRTAREELVAAALMAARATPSVDAADEEAHEVRASEPPSVPLPGAGVDAAQLCALGACTIPAGTPRLAPGVYPSRAQRCAD